MENDNIDIKELFLDILTIVKFELKFYKVKESPLFERIVKTRVFQQKLQKLKDFINTYFEIMYKDENSPINKAALKSQLDNIARIMNYYDDLSQFYRDHTSMLIPKEKLQSLVDFSHIEVLFLVFTNILDWEHYKSSLIFPHDKQKEKLLKEFLNKIASSDIKEIEDLIDLEQTIDSFVKSIETEL
jgi:GTP1/Obg family GTP-binding protein